MQLTPPPEWTGLATRQDLANVETRLEADIRTTEANLIGEMHRLLRIQTIWLIGAMFSLAGLILAAAKFL